MLEDGDEVTAGDLTITALLTPGHSPGHLSFLVNGTDCFTADVLFHGTVGGTMRDSYESLHHSIMDVLMKLPPETRVHPGHTDPTTIGAEWDENVFVRLWRGVDPVGREPCTVNGRAATLELFAARLRRRAQGARAVGGRKPRRRPGQPGREGSAPMTENTALTMPLSRSRKISMLVLTILPFVGLIAAVTLLWNEAVGWTDLVLFLGLYVICGFGITIGYHRMLTHHAFEAVRRSRPPSSSPGSFALQGSALDWAIDHRTHHAYSDKEGDPHSPHHGFARGPLGAIKGLLHAHMGWMFRHNRTDQERYAKDILQDRMTMTVSRLFPLWVGADVRRAVRPRRPAHDVVEGRRHGPRLGRPRPPLLQPPRHVERELDLPLLRQAAVRGERPVDEQLGAGAAVARRVVAPQPPRLPDVGLPRALVAPDRPLGPGDRRLGEDRARAERSQADRRSRSAAS